MNSRQRILAAIQHHEPEQLPVDLGSTPSSGISAIAYDNLVKYLDLKDKRNWVYDVVQQVSQPSKEVLDRFHIDAIDLGRTFNRRDSDWYNYTLLNNGTAQQPVWFRPQEQPDGSRLAFVGATPIARMPASAISYDQIIYPFLEDYPTHYRENMDKAMGLIHWSALAHSPWDHASEPDFWQKLRRNALALRQHSERAIVLSAGCNLFEWGTFLRRLDQFMMDLVRAPVKVERFLDALLERHLRSLEKICQAVGDLVDIIRLGDDLGMNTGPLMSPQMYRRYFKPRHTLLCEYIKRHSQMHILLHSCGSIYQLIPDLLEAGFEILNPVQTNTRDMQPERLKREFGSQTTFWGGGADTRSILNFGTPGQVRENVRRNIESLAPGGGFVFNTIHNILPDVPPENIEAMFAAVDEYR
jgi:uroporphyrinogen decarboxylase